MKKQTSLFLSAILLPGFILAQATQKPTKIDFSSGDAATETANTAEKSTAGDDKLDPETQRLIQEAREKIIRERAEKLAAEKKAAEDEARRKGEEEKLKSRRPSDARVYVGAVGSLGVSLNSFNGTGYAFGGTLDAIFAERFGLHFGFSTGSFKTKGSTLKAGNSTLTISGGESIGYLEFDFAAAYIFPKFLNIETSLGGGVMFHQLGAKAFGFGNQAAPMILASAFFPIVPYIETGILTNIAFPRASSVTSASGSYALDNSQSLTNLSIFVSVRLLVH